MWRSKRRAYEIVAHKTDRFWNCQSLQNEYVTYNNSVTIKDFKNCCSLCNLRIFHVICLNELFSFCCSPKETYCSCIMTYSKQYNVILCKSACNMIHMNSIFNNYSMSVCWIWDGKQPTRPLDYNQSRIQCTFLE